MFVFYFCDSNILIIPPPPPKKKEKKVRNTHTHTHTHTHTNTQIHTHPHARTQELLRSEMELWPVYDHLSLAQELSLVARLSLAVVDEQVGADLNAV